MLFTNIAVATSNHYGLVIAATLTGKISFKGTKITTKIRSAKFIIKRRTTNGALNHNIQGRYDTIRLAVIFFPRLSVVRDLQVRHSKANQTHFWLGATTYRTLIANFSTRTRTRTRKRCNSSRMIMGFNLHQQMHRFLRVTILFRHWVRIKAPAHTASNHSGIIGISREYIFATQFMSIANHAKQTVRLVFAI